VNDLPGSHSFAEVSRTFKLPIGASTYYITLDSGGGIDNLLSRYVGGVRGVPTSVI